MSELLFLNPVFKEAVWGGSRLKEQFGYDIPGSHTGECWAISAHENGDCEVAEGEYKGMRLSELWAAHPELFGNEDGRLGDRFPLLIKIIDARDDLSIQVHPDNTMKMALWARQSAGTSQTVSRGLPLSSAITQRMRQS